jgi:hypothetical protein
MDEVELGDLVAVRGRPADLLHLQDRMARTSDTTSFRCHSRWRESDGPRPIGAPGGGYRRDDATHLRRPRRIQLAT